MKQSIWPYFPIYSLAADSVFHIPLWRHVIAWLGARPATRPNFLRLLKRGSVAVLVGGIAEMFMQDARRERLMLRSRKGFTRVAVSSDLFCFC
jgi:diacylglycerol O-acyltransferase 2, plant